MQGISRTATRSCNFEEIFECKKLFTNSEGKTHPYFKDRNL